MASKTPRTSKVWRFLRLSHQTILAVRRAPGSALWGVIFLKNVQCDFKPSSFSAVKIDGHMDFTGWKRFAICLSTGQMFIHLQRSNVLWQLWTMNETCGIEITSTKLNHAALLCQKERLVSCKVCPVTWLRFWLMHNNTSWHCCKLNFPHRRLNFLLSVASPLCFCICSNSLCDLMSSA